jgi:hypothetical protein
MVPKPNLSRDIGIDDRVGTIFHQTFAKAAG